MNKVIPALKALAAILAAFLGLYAGTCAVKAEYFPASFTNGRRLVSGERAEVHTSVTVRDRDVILHIGESKFGQLRDHPIGGYLGPPNSLLGEFPDSFGDHNI